MTELEKNEDFVELDEKTLEILSKGKQRESNNERNLNFIQNRHRLGKKSSLKASIERAKPNSSKCTHVKAIALLTRLS